MSKDVYKIAGNDASNYDEYLGPLIFEPAAQELLKHITPWPAHAILEIACGTGRMTRHLRENFPRAGNLVATDINNDMLNIARQQLNDPSITFQVADAQQLPFADNAFDLVMNQFGLMFLPDRQKGMQEAYRVLQPGGHFVFTTWDSTASMPLFKLLIDEVIIPQFAGEDTSRFHKPFAMNDPDLLNGWLEEAGFSAHRVVPLTFKGRAESPQHIVTTYFTKHPLGREVQAHDPSSVDRVAHELEQKLTQQFGAGPFDVALRAFAGIGTK